jgi:hypothetical protein
LQHRKHDAFLAMYRRDMHVLHFTAKVEPLNFYARYHPNWSQEFELAWVYIEQKIRKVVVAAGVWG